MGIIAKVDLMDRMTIEETGVIYDARQQPNDRRIAFFTSLCQLASGRILCTFQVGSKKHAPNSQLGLCWSDDRGRSWHESDLRVSNSLNNIPGSLGAGELVEVSRGKLLMFATWFDRSDPQRPLFDPETHGILRSRQLLSVSMDDGQTWSPWQTLSTGELRGTALTGPIVHWDNGVIGFCFESFREFDDPQDRHHAAWITLSADGGNSFRAPVCIAEHPQHSVYYWDQRLTTRPSSPQSPSVDSTAIHGNFTALFWTHDLQQQKDLSVHILHGSTNPDSPRSLPQPTGIRGQIAAPLWISPERLLAFVVDRSQPATMTLWQSEDAGKTWNDTEALVVYRHDEQARLSQGESNIDFAQYWEDMGKWTFGHPALIRLSESHVLAAWYAGTPDQMSIHWARIRLTEGTH